MIDNKARILIVDDRPDRLLALEAALEDLEQTVVRAYSGREALRHVLDCEFAVILLDVNMPGMDGFETAAIIRQRKSSEHIPIIFITAFGDEIHMARGYQLGAVDYIMAPVNPSVLRSKVGVFVELYNKTAQVSRQTESLRRRAAQLQKLAAASVAINSALSIEKMLQTITDSARDIVGAHQAVSLFNAGPAGASQQQERPPRQIQAVLSFSERYVSRSPKSFEPSAVAATFIGQSRTPLRMSDTELQQHPDWEILQRAQIPPIREGLLSAPLSGRGGANLGVIYLAERFTGNFTNDDEAVLVQLAQMASIAVENTLYAQEREANRLKDEFLATLSHELRTPLNAIIGWTQLLKLEGSDGDIAHGLEVIERNAQSQAKLIEDLLDVSRITTGKMRLSMRPTIIGPVISAAVDAVRPLADAKKIELDCKLDAPDAQLLADPDRLQQVVWNLLTNAAKFTPNGGRISIRLKQSRTPAGMLELSVTDNGMGIDSKFLPSVFDRFRQADSSSTRSHGGLGIGLTVVRHIVDLHGGTVRAESGGAGCGTVFIVTLPINAIPAHADDVGLPRAGGAASNTDSPSNLSRLHVLVVDDEADAREVETEILRRAGARVSAAATAREALSLLSNATGTARPDVLISDIAMPDEDGYALISAVRRLPPAQGGCIPAIAVTAYAREEDRQRALAAGFRAHLDKPIVPIDLITAVSSAVPDQPAADRPNELRQFDLSVG